jgi:hypothetical protein
MMFLKTLNRNQPKLGDIASHPPGKAALPRRPAIEAIFTGTFVLS